MTFFIRHVLFLHIVALILVFSWIHGGTRADLLLPVIPWLTAFVLEGLLVFPQAKATETLTEARERVWKALRRDPLTYVSMTLVLLLVIPLFNVAKLPVYDAVTQQWQNFSPPVTWLPYCVASSEHAVLLLWFPPVLVAALAARHGLLMRCKRLLLKTICWNGAALSVVGWAQLYTGTDKLLWLTPMKSYFFSTFGYPNFAGAFFTLMTGLAIGLWFQDVTEKIRASMMSSSVLPDEKSWFVVHSMMVPAALCFTGAIASLSRAAILLCVLLVGALTVYMIIYVWNWVTSGTRVMIFAGLFATIVLIGALFVVFKLDALKREIGDISVHAVVDRVSGTGLYHKRVAQAIFWDHPLFGVGGWGYPHYQVQYLSPEEIKRMQIDGGANVHNDTLQFLAEQGAIGYALIILCVVLLVVPVLWRAWLVCRVKITDSEGNPCKAGQFYRFPIPLVGVVIGTGATICHSLGDLPFRDPAVMLVWVLAWACVPGWIPNIRKTVKG